MSAEWKEKELQRRTLNLLKRCRHFNGIQNTECRAGINYRQMVGGDDFGWAARLPCFIDENSAVSCALISLRTEAEARKEVEEKDARVQVFLKQLANGICPTCKVQVKQRQVGHCVYGTCGHRLYQGTVNPRYAASAVQDREAIGE